MNIKSFILKLLRHPAVREDVMRMPEKIKEKYAIFQEYFTFKDFIGLSALIFGLLLANTPMETAEIRTDKAPQSTIQKENYEKTVKKKKIKSRNTKKAIKRLQKQRVTAARKS